MNIFTKDDYRKIQAWLKANSIKDSDLTSVNDTIPEEDTLVLVQKINGILSNVKISIKNLLNSTLSKIIIDTIIANAVKVNNIFTVTASNVKIDNEKGTTLQDVLDYFEDNKLNRHTDDTFDGNLTVKKNITIEGNIKSHDDTITVEADLEATGEITDGQGNILSDVNSAAKQWSLEYQDPQQDEPTVRAKYVLKDYRGVPKGSVIKIYKDSAITNVYLGTVEDTCNPNTGEVTKHPIHDNNEALSIVYRLNTGKYSLVNVPIKMFVTEAEFDKYRGLGVTENGQVFIKLASDVESSNYLHFNASGEISADGIENRILQDLGTIINSVAGDNTMWGQYKKEEGTKDSPINETSRWGQYKQAETDRNERLNNLENQIEEEKVAIIRTNRIADEAVTAPKLSSDIQALISNLSKNALFAGIATPTTNPGTPDGPVFYLATEVGAYSNFGSIELTEGEAVILYWNNDSWAKKTTGFATQKSVESISGTVSILSSALILANSEVKLSVTDFKLGKFSSKGIFSDADKVRMCLVKWPLLSPFILHATDGYVAAYYLYDKNGKYVRNNEAGVADLEVDNTEIGYISLAFKYSDGAPIEALIEPSNIIASITGLAFPIGKYVEKAKNSVEEVKEKVKASVEKINTSIEEVNASVNNIDIDIDLVGGIILSGLNIGDECTFKKDISTEWVHVVYQAPENGHMYLTTTGGYNNIAYAILDSSNIVIQIATKAAVLHDEMLQIEKGQKVVINSHKASEHSAIFVSDTNSINGIKSDIISLQRHTASIEEATTTEVALYGAILVVNSAQECSTVLTDSDIVITGRNILNTASVKYNKIINDNGTEVHDSASFYYDYYIPVLPGMVLISLFNIERYYKYDKNKAFISRTDAISKETPFTIPEGVYWIKIQSKDFDNKKMVAYGDILPDYEDFRSNTQKIAYTSMSIYNPNRNDINIRVRKFYDFSAIQKQVFNLLENSGLKEFTVEKKSEIISFSDELAKKVQSLICKPSVTMIGKNILDETTIKKNYIINDSGAEVYDGISSYYQQYIPCKGKSIISTFVIQRLYLYDADKNFLRRTDSISANTVYVIPSGVYFIQIQINKPEISQVEKMVLFDGIGDISTYESYRVLSQIPNTAFSVYSNGVDKVNLTMKFTARYYIPEVGEYDYWEPEEVTDAFSCPIGQGTQSVEGLTYELVLSNYFDIYANKAYADGYKVLKKGLGNDSGNTAESPLGNEVFTYEFIPKHYSRTVLLSAGMNACELSGIFGIAYFIKALMEHNEPGMNALYNTTRFIVMPCICPSCLNSSPIKYTNYNGIRINKNFNYNGSWKKIKETNPQEPVGPYPDSEVETILLKKWINSYPESTLWIDCHSDAGSRGYTNLMTQVICSDSYTDITIRMYWAKMKTFYEQKGYITVDQEVFRQSWVDTGGYPKTLYSKYVCGTPAIMIEQYISSTTYGSDGETNNDSFGIKNYTSLIRAYVLSMCKGEMIIK